MAMRLLRGGARFVHDRTWKPFRSIVSRIELSLTDQRDPRVFEISLSSMSVSNTTTEVATGADKIGNNSTATATATGSIPYPGSFITSSFFIMLLALSILLNRIHHLVPPRRPLFLNQDVSQPFLSKRMRFLLRLPSLFLLLRASTMITALLLASKIDYTTRIESTTYFSDHFIAFAAKLHSWPKLWPLFYPHLLSSYLERGMTPQASALTHSLVSAHQIMWDVFIAVSSTSVTETFIRALTDDLSSLASFNLLSFALLLQTYSSPLAWMPAKANDASSPTEWILPTPLYLHLLFVLLELFFLHLSFVFTPPLKPMRLYITGFFSLFGQSVHLFGIVRAVRSLSSSSSAASSWNASPLVHEAFTAAGTIWLSAIMPDVIFECLSILTISLKTLAALLRREEIDAELIFGHRAHWPKRTDDWGLAMLNYGQSCLASSTLAGLANEVSPLRILAPVPLSFLSLQLPAQKPSAPEEDYVELSRSLTESGSIHARLPSSSSSSTVRNRKQKRFGYSNEIKSIKTRRRDEINQPSSGVFDSRRSRYKAYFEFLNLIWRIGFYVFYQTYLWGKKFIWNVLDFWGFVEEKDRDEGTMEEWKSAGTGEEWEDEMDRDWVPSEDEDDEEDEGSDSSQSDDNAKEEEVAASEEEVTESVNEEEENEDDDVAELLQDLIGAKPNRLRRRRERTPIASTSSSRAVSPFVPPRSEFEDEDQTSLAPVLLAHHLQPTGSSPLTRRRYATLASQAYPQSTAFSSALASRQQQISLSLTSQQLAIRQEALSSSAQRFCIICTAEERTIVCWPCRCLTMCEDCRLSLSERMAGNQGSQLCVTCRKPIEGFSRIFIP